MTTPASSIALVMFGSVIGSLGAAGLKAGAHHLEMNFKSLVTNWRLAGGISLYLLSTVFFMLGLKNGELSVLYPMVSVGYICGMFWSKLFFGESVTQAKIGALALILCGCVLLGMGIR